MNTSFKFINNEDLHLDWENIKSASLSNYSKHYNRNYFDIDTSFIFKHISYFLDTSDIPTSIFNMKYGEKYYAAAGNFASVAFTLDSSTYTNILVYKWYSKKKSRYAYFVKKNDEYYCALYVIYYNGILFDGF